MTDKERIEQAVRSLPPLPFPLREGRCGAPAVCDTRVPGVYRVERLPRPRREDENEDAEEDEEEDEAERWYVYASSARRAREIFSDEVLAMGEEEDGLWFGQTRCRYAVQYELCRYRQRMASGRERSELEREAQTCALFGAMEESDYFGEWTPPERTPCGARTRYRKADAGVWFVEGGATWFLATVRPLLSIMDGEALNLACVSAAPLSAYAFWPLEACALVVYQLLYDMEREGLRAWITSREDLVNAIWRAHPAFARERQRFAEIVKKVEAACGGDGGPALARLCAHGPRRPGVSDQNGFAP